MDYKQALREQMEQYYQITARYRSATVDAMKDARRPGLLKKRDYSGHIARFAQLKEDIRTLSYKDIQVPEEDAEGQNFLKLFDRSVISFLLLCDENIHFYEMTDRKQCRNSGITVKDYAEETAKLQQILGRAVEETGYLEQAYKEYFAAEPADN